MERNTMEINDGKQLKVSAIKNGTVLDHIPSCQVFKVIDILGLSGSEHPVTFGVNLDSKSMGRKGIIKISERFFKSSPPTPASTSSATSR